MNLRFAGNRFAISGAAKHMTVFTKLLTIVARNKLLDFAGKVQGDFEQGFGKSAGVEVQARRRDAEGLKIGGTWEPPGESLTQMSEMPVAGGKMGGVA